MSEPIRAHVALGSNLGDRAAHLVGARRALCEDAALRLVGASRIWETEPVGPVEQGRYLNAVLALDVRATPRDLLDRLLEIERRAGRDRTREPVRWGPRVLDLDLLLFGDRLVDEPGLEIPHPRLHERSFVLAPLCEIAPQLVHPRLGGTLAWHLARCEASGRARRWDGRSDWTAIPETDPEGRKIET
jgi:2-amino-4-hydroxy-6-hydroxymethyldihydropteridine diphosphokinase